MGDSSYVHLKVYKPIGEVSTGMPMLNSLETKKTLADPLVPSIRAKRGVADWINKAKDTAQGLIDKAQDLVDKAKETAEDMLQKAEEAAKDLVEKTKEKANELVEKAQDVMENAG